MWDRGTGLSHGKSVARVSKTCRNRFRPIREEPWEGLLTWDNRRGSPGNRTLNLRIKRLSLNVRSAPKKYLQS